MRAGAGAGGMCARERRRLGGTAGRDRGARAGLGAPHGRDTPVCAFYRRRLRLRPDAIQLLQRETGLESSYYGGERTAFVVLQDLRVGDPLEYSFSRVGRNPVLLVAFLLFWATAVVVAAQIILYQQIPFPIPEADKPRPGLLLPLALWMAYLVKSARVRSTYLPRSPG